MVSAGLSSFNIRRLAVRAWKWVWDSAGAVTKTALGWLIPMLLTASVTAYISYVYNQKANTLLVVQQQRVADLQQFRSSGAQLDQALARMSDALVDRKGLEAAREEMRLAIARNISDAEAAKPILGESQTNQYVAGLADLRVTVDGVQKLQSGQQLWQASINMMEARRRILREAEQRALA